MLQSDYRSRIRFEQQLNYIIYIVYHEVVTNYSVNTTKSLPFTSLIKGGLTLTNSVRNLVDDHLILTIEHPHCIFLSFDLLSSGNLFKYFSYHMPAMEN